MVISSRIVTDKHGFNFPKTAVLATRTPKDNAGRFINNKVRHMASTRFTCRIRPDMNRVDLASVWDWG
ncbi:hypothetical protein DPMN_189560 [Dreissena polymorpha]|uniref:Uncharacterized protein n=1 Tax=Dreissena polymorpha TaxID=45954 RepID=A0A9D4DS56_DREPO|nr:hypothetical protein DPMN_189560 [Dreissena polymorpha]